MYSLLWKVKKKCSKCSELKPVAKFYLRKRVKSRLGGKLYYLDSWCKDCVNKANKRWAYEHSEQRKVIKQRYYRKNKNRMNLQMKENYKRLRLEFIEAYGGKCSCCGEQEPIFLTVEHIDGGGGAERKRRSSHQLLVKLRREGYPKGEYTVLCYNCNCTRGFFGVCPHELLVKEDSYV